MAKKLAKKQRDILAAVEARPRKRCELCGQDLIAPARDERGGRLNSALTSRGPSSFSTSVGATAPSP